MNCYYVWPDGWFVHKDDVDDWTFQGRSDDYSVVYVADWADSEEVEDWFSSSNFPNYQRPRGILIREELSSLANKLRDLATVTLDCPNLNSLLVWAEMAVLLLSKGKRRGAEWAARGAQERLNPEVTWIGSPFED